MKLIEPKIKHCLHPDQLTKAIELNLPESVVCNKCPHHPTKGNHECCNYNKCKAQKDDIVICTAFQSISSIRSDDIVFCTHDMSLYLAKILKHLNLEVYTEKYQGGTLIFDEVDNVIQRLVYQFDWLQIKKTYEYLNQLTITTGISQFIDEVIRIQHINKQLLNKRELITIDRSWQDYQMLKTKAQEAIKSLLDSIANLAGNNPKTKTKVDDIIALLWDIFIDRKYDLIENKTYSEVKNKVKEVCYEAYINYDIFNLLFALLQDKLLIHVTNKSIYFTIKKRLDLEKMGNPSQTILLDATIHIPTIKKVINWLNEPVELAVWPKRVGRIYHIKDTTSRKYIRQALSGKDSAKEKQLFYALQMAKQLALEKTSWIVPQVQGENGNLLDIVNQFSRQNTYHFSSISKGSNRFSETEAMVIFGQPIATPISYLLLARTLISDDQLEQNYRQWLPTAACLQEIGRHRQLFDNPNSRLMLINSQYPDEILNVIGLPDISLHNPLANAKSNQKLINAYTKLIKHIDNNNINNLQSLTKSYHEFLNLENVNNDSDFANRVNKYLKTFYDNNVLLPAWKEAWESTVTHITISGYSHNFVQLSLPLTQTEQEKIVILGQERPPT